MFEVEVKDRLQVQGTVVRRRGKDAPSILVKDTKVVLLRSPAKKTTGEPDQGVVATQFFLAAIRRIAEAYFIRERFEQFEPSFLTSSKSASQIEPLAIIFPGYGGSSYLAPSPAPQLMEAILVSSNPRVFCVSRCFSGSIRDGYTSAESLILCAHQLDASLDQMCILAQGAVKAVFHQYATRPKLSAPKEQQWLETSAWPVKERDWSDLELTVQEPEIHRYRAHPASSNERAQSIFRVCWPTDVVLAEGHTELVDGRVPLGGITIHLERMVPLLRDVTLRRLRQIVRPRSL